MTVISTLYVHFINGHHYFHTVTIVDRYYQYLYLTKSNSNKYVRTLYTINTYTNNMAYNFARKLFYLFFNFI